MPGLYVHIPFCRVKCPYCSFVVFVGREPLRDAYVDALCAEIARRAERVDPADLGVERSADGRLPLSTVYLGGGTPSLLPAASLARVLDTVRASFALADDAEITAETEPGTTSSSTFADLRALGVNRVTVGVQSFDAALLAALGRAHDPDDARAAIRDAREAGVENLDLDLMFGAPGQSEERWRRDLEEALAHRPEHLSLYNLTVEPGTPFATAARKGLLPLPGEDSQARMMRFAMARCAEAGLPQYEISNFARPGRASRHNRGYWTGAPYLGVGVGAHGFLPRAGRHGLGVRTWNVRGLERYRAALDSGGLPEEGREDLDRDAAMLEALYLGLRQRVGLDLAAFAARFGVDPAAAMESRLARDDLRAAARIRDGTLSLTEDGVIIADYVVSELAGLLDTLGG